MQLSQFGLEPDGRHAHLIPFWNSKTNSYDCQLIIDYKGLANLAMRSGFVSYVHADKICERDLFVYDRGAVVRHEINFKEDRGPAYAYYAMVKFKDGSEKADVMTMSEVKAIRARSKAGTSGPWVTDFDEMGKKTVFRRLSKWLPLSPEYRDAVDLDADALEELRFDQAKPLIKRAEVPKQLKEKNGPAPVPRSPAVEPMPEMELEPPPVPSAADAWAKFGTPEEKKTVLKKKRGRPPLNKPVAVPEEVPAQSNADAMVSRLSLGGFTTDNLMAVARENDWALDTDSWPLPEEKLAKFLHEDNWPTIQEELEALPK
jgi:recombination protein RecT